MAPLQFRFVLEEEEDLGENWVLVSGSWTRGELRQVDTMTMLELVDTLLPKKIQDCHLTKANGDSVTDPNELRFDKMDDFDQRIFAFLVSIPRNISRELFFLGSSNVRALSLGRGVTSSKKTTSEEQNSQ